MSIFNMLSARGVGSAGGRVATSSQIFTTPGSSTWTCPFGVGSVSVVCIGGGGGGGSGGAGAAGGGGALTYADNISVIPGTTYDIQVGSAGAVNGSGGTSWFNSSSFLYANGGNAGASATAITLQPVNQTTFSPSATASLFTVPTSVTSICAVTIGGGASGSTPSGGVAGGGGGGGLGWKNNISVTPGQQLIVQCGLGGASPSGAWNTTAYESAAGQDSWVGTLSVTGTGSIASGPTVTLTSGTTTGWSAYIGQTIVVYAGNGQFQRSTTISSITNSTQFVVSKAPIFALSATSFAIGTPLVAGYGGNYPTGQVNVSGTLYNYYGQSGGSHLGDGGGNGGSGGSGSINSITGGQISGNGGGGGAGGYSGNGGGGGSVNTNNSTGPSAGGGGGGGAGGGGCGSYGQPSQSGYNAVRAGHGGGVGIYGSTGVNGTGGTQYTYQTGQSGTGGSGGFPTVNYLTGVTTNYAGATTSSGTGSWNVTAVSGDFSTIVNQSGFTSGWACGSNNNSVGFASFSSSTNASLNSIYSGGVTTGNRSSTFYAMGFMNVDTGAGASGQSAQAGNGAVRLIWGSGRSFPNTLTTDQTVSAGGGSANYGGGGGGGAGGYTGAGGNGGSASSGTLSAGGTGGTGGGSVSGVVSYAGGTGGSSSRLAYSAYSAGTSITGGGGAGGAGGVSPYGGGGVGYNGAGSSGTAGAATTSGSNAASASNGGSSGGNGTTTTGGAYGGGAPPNGTGGVGAVMIRWGVGTAY